MLHRRASSFGGLLICISLLWLIEKPIYANGAVATSGAFGSVPGPIVKTPLVLQKEIVIIGNETVEGQYCVYNPTDDPIHVTIGFPVASLISENATPDAQKYENLYISEVVLPKFVAKVGDTSFPVRRATELQSIDNPLVFAWDMSFPPRVVTQLSFNYPMIPEMYAGDNDGERISYEYITHTGSYWAAPIGEATIILRVSRIVNLIRSYSPGYYWAAPGYARIEVEWSLSPLPYEFSGDGNAIVWHRRNWSPQKGIDDIKVSAGYYDRPISDSSHLAGDDLEAYPTGRDLQELPQIWCGQQLDPPMPPLAEQMSICDHEIDAAYFRRFLEQAYQYWFLTQTLGEPVLVDHLPLHIQADFSLQVLNYLHECVLLCHGDRMDAQGTAQCLPASAHPRPWSKTDKRSLAFLAKRKKELETQSKTAWKIVRRRLISLSDLHLYEAPR